MMMRLPINKRTDPLFPYTTLFGLLRVDDLAPLGALAGQAMSGVLDADLHVAGDATAPRLAIDLDARGGAVGLADPLPAAIVGTAPRLASSVTQDGERTTIARADRTTAPHTEPARARTRALHGKRAPEQVHLHET